MTSDVMILLYMKMKLIETVAATAAIVMLMFIPVSFDIRFVIISTGYDAAKNRKISPILKLLKKLYCRIVGTSTGNDTTKMFHKSQYHVEYYPCNCREKRAR